MLRWIMLALAALAATIGLSAPASAQYANRVKCESRNYQPNSCAIGNASDVRIVERLGGNCRQGADWNFDRRAIYVSNGCRALFEVRSGNNNGGNYGGGNYGGGYGNARTVRCESENYRTNRCAVDTRGGVRINRVLGNSQCRQGQSFGWDRGGIWVSNGCRAEFIVGSDNGYGGNNGGGYGGNPNGQTIECSSKNWQPARCNANISRGVEITQVLGGECIQGRTWGWDRGGIWVNNGCRARFRVY